MARKKSNTAGWDFACAMAELACATVVSGIDNKPRRAAVLDTSGFDYELEVWYRGGNIKIQRVVERISHESEWYTGGYVTYDMFSKILNADWDRKLYPKYTDELRQAVMEAMGYVYDGRSDSNKYWRFKHEVLKPKEVPVTEEERIDAMIWVVKKAYPLEYVDNIVFHYLGKTIEERKAEVQKYYDSRQNEIALRGIAFFSGVIGIPAAFLGLCLLFEHAVNVWVYG